MVGSWSLLLGLSKLPPIDQVIGELPYQSSLPKEQRSNIHFDDNNGPDFYSTQKKKVSHKKITRPNGGGGSRLILGSDRTDWGLVRK
jgi:hypothetical protein